MLTHFNDLWGRKLTKCVSLWAQKLLKWGSIVSSPRKWQYGSVSGPRNWHYGREILYASVACVTQTVLHPSLLCGRFHTKKTHPKLHTNLDTFHFTERIFFDFVFRRVKKLTFLGTKPCRIFRWGFSSYSSCCYKPKEKNPPPKQKFKFVLGLKWSSWSGT